MVGKDGRRMEQEIKTYRKLKTLPAGSVTARGWIREQLLRNKAGMGGHLDELEPNMIALPYINCTTDEEWGAVKAGWGAEISGNYWYGLILLAFALDDPELKAKAEKWVNGVLKNQRPNGYMGTYTPEDDWFDDYNAWGTHCGMKAMLLYYEATGRKDVLDAVHRCMLWFCENWKGDRKTRYAGVILIESMAVCYFHTGDERLVTFIDEYVDFLDRNDLYLNSATAMLEEKLIYASMHAAGYASDLSLYALAYAAGGNERNLAANLNGLKKVKRQVMQRTGGMPCHAEYLSPRSASVETEYCNFSFLEDSLIHVNAITGDPQYADWIERIVFNGAQGARKKDEKAIAYMSSPNQIFANGNSCLFEQDMQQYAPVYPVSCCPVTSVWAVPDYVRSMALTDGKNLYISAYGPARITFGDLVISEETFYPFRDRLTFRVEAASEETIAINFRIPGWCDAATFTVNGVSFPGAVKGSYFPIRRCWKAGDVVEVVLPRQVTVDRVDDSDASGKFPLCVEYGPLVFALPIPEVWVPVKGNPRTPLPEGWSWWDVYPKLLENDTRGSLYEQNGLRKYNISWNVAIDEKVDCSKIRVEEREDTGYVWEDAPIKLRVPGYKALFSYPPYIRKTMDVWQAPAEVQEELELELVPFGCTNLRITYFPRAKTE